MGSGLARELSGAGLCEVEVSVGRRDARRSSEWRASGYSLTKQVTRVDGQPSRACQRGCRTDCHPADSSAGRVRVHVPTR